MTAERKCPQCGAALATNAPHGLCPQCLGRMAIGTSGQTSAKDEAQLPRDLLPNDPSMIGQTISHYRLVDKIGQGGMGEVFLAEDLSLRRQVALKFLPSEMERDPTARLRFLREARSAAVLNHPYICSVHDVCEAQGKDFIVMEYVEGETLRAKLTRGPISLKESLQIALEMAEALERAHDQGIIHRDLKPSNLMLPKSGHVKVMDFGLAKRVQDEQRALTEAITVTALTREGSTLGTVAYMSPEQLRGQTVDGRSDIFSFGIVLYEILTGVHPFRQPTLMDTAAEILERDPAPLSRHLPKVPHLLQQILSRMLAKNLDRRYARIQEVHADLNRLHRQLDQAERSLAGRYLRKPAVAIPAAVLVVALGYLAIHGLYRSRQARWAHQVLLPQIEQFIIKDDFGSAYKLAEQAGRYIPDDPDYKALAAQVSGSLSVRTTPPGAEVFVKDYRRIGDPWKSLGRTPLDKVRVPLVFCRWKIGLTDYETAEGALMASVESYPLVLDVKLDKQGALPKGMVHVAGGKFKPDLDGLNQEAVAELELSDFLLDRCEVSNRQFKEFVKAGGYTKPEYWMHKFTQENRELAWEEAMKLLVDKTGRRGPATWEFADYPQGQDDHPVTGVSWFEAAAYAEWAGKNLPTVYEWTLAAMGFIQPEAFKLAGLHRPYYVGFVIALSNFGGKGPTPGGTFHGVSARGIYDMAGNVKEWCLNETTNGQRFTLGGAWNEQLYTFYSTDFYAPLMREANFGFRCMKSLAQNEASILAARPLAPWSSPSRGDQKPCSDEVFEAYQRLYTYKKSDLNPKVEQRQDLTPYTRLEKVSFDAAYGNERMVAYLFIPRTGKPPFQTIVHYPGAGAWTLPKFEDCGFAADAEYRTKTGRAFVVPVLKDTFERRLPPEKRGSTGCEVCILCAKDVMRTIDYLEMRPEFDTNKFIYEGLSLGAIWGGIIPAVERRFKVAVMFAGGLRAGMPPDHSQINFAPRITIPVLMQNGRYDSAFPLETSVKPLLALIATPEKDKYLKVYESGHSVWKLNEFLKDEFNFLDQYLGPPR